MEVGLSKETVEMFEERVGRWQTSLLLRVVLWGMIAWALTPPVIALLFVFSSIRDLAWGDTRAILLAIGITGTLFMAGSAGVILGISLIARRVAKTTEVAAENAAKSALEAQTLAQEAIETTLAAQAVAQEVQETTLAAQNTVLNLIKADKEMVTALEARLVDLADHLERTKAMEPSEANQLRQLAADVVETQTPPNGESFPETDTDMDSRGC